MKKILGVFFLVMLMLAGGCALFPPSENEFVRAVSKKFNSAGTSVLETRDDLGNSKEGTFLICAPDNKLVWINAELNGFGGLRIINVSDTGVKCRTRKENFQVPEPPWDTSAIKEENIN